MYFSQQYIPASNKVVYLGMHLDTKILKPHITAKIKFKGKVEELNWLIVYTERPMESSCGVSPVNPILQ